MDKVRNGLFDALVAPHLQRLFRVACRMLGNTADARDLVQDTCLVACQNLAELQRNSNPVRWLLRVQRNRLIDLARRRQRAPVVPLRKPDMAERHASAEPGPEQQLAQAEDERALDLAFSRLDETQRLLLSLRAEGYNLEEIGAITGLASDVLRGRLHRARRSLAQYLAEQQGTPARANQVRGL